MGIMPLTKKKRILIGWTFMKNLEEPDINNLNFYPSQPISVNGVLDNSFKKVKITIKEV
jgi:hypothetical protein